jgi:hypothetical protein
MRETAIAAARATTTAKVAVAVSFELTKASLDTAAERNHPGVPDLMMFPHILNVLAGGYSVASGAIFSPVPRNPELTAEWVLAATRKTT